MLKKISFLSISCLLSFISISFSQNYIRSSVVVDTPTAYTIYRGIYEFYFTGYDSGGVEVKSFIGLHDNFFLGVSFDIQKAIGKDDPEPNIPGVIAKLKITDGWQRFPISFTVGYDSFYIGGEGSTENYENELNRMIYGPYFVVTKPIYLFQDEQHISAGIRVPTQPYYVPEDTAYFISLDIPLGSSIIFKAEGERIYYDFSRHREWLLNLGLKYSYLNHLGIEFLVMFQKQDRANRMLRIQFSDQF